jgi:hypothetical protein
MGSEQHTCGQQGHTAKTTRRDASHSLTGCRIRRDPDASVEQGEKTQCGLVRWPHASIASQQHTSEQKGAQQAPHGGQQADHSPAGESGGIQMHVWGKAKEHNAGYSEGHMPAQPASITHLSKRANSKHHTAGNKPITHHLQIQEGSRCMCGVRRKNTMQASQKGHMPAWVANKTHVCSKGTQQAPHGGKQADHSLAAESGGIQMQVWSTAQEHNAGQSEGHMQAWVANNTHAGSKGTQQTPHGGKQADHSPPAESGGNQMHEWGRTKEHNAGQLEGGACQHGKRTTHMRAARANTGSKPITHFLQN